MFSRAHARAVRTPNVKFGVFALLAGVRLWDIGLADFGAGQVDPGVALVAFDHRPAGEGLHTETRHQVPRVVVCNRRKESGLNITKLFNKAVYT